MNFVGLIGDMGSGKTCYATALLWQDHLLGRRIVANYRLQFPHRLMSFDELKTFPADLHDSTVVMDELGTGADSYSFMSQGNKDITKLVTQIRKRDSLVYYTVQRFKFITKRLRDLTDGFVLFEDLDKHLDHRKTGFICTGNFKLQFLDHEGQPTRPPVMFDGKPYWDMYDSKEIIW